MSATTRDMAVVSKRMQHSNQGISVAARNYRETDRLRSRRRLGWAAACFVLGFVPLMLVAALHNPT